MQWGPETEAQRFFSGGLVGLGNDQMDKCKASHVRHEKIMESLEVR